MPQRSNAKFVITTLQWQRRYCSSAFLGESRRVFFSIDYLIICFFARPSVT